MAVGKPSKNGTFRIKDTSGQWRTFTCNLTSFQRKNTRTTTKTETYCTVEKSPGPNDITYTGKGIYNGSANEISRVLEQLINYSTAASEYEWLPQGEVDGEEEYTGTGWVVDKNIDATVPGSVLIDFTVESVTDTLGTVVTS